MESLRPHPQPLTPEVLVTTIMRSTRIVALITASMCETGLRVRALGAEALMSSLDHYSGAVYCIAVLTIPIDTGGRVPTKYVCLPFMTYRVPTSLLLYACH